MLSRHSFAAPPDGKPPRLARVRRKPDRARYDMPEVHAVLDAAPFCHVATIRGGRPVVLPMAYGRLGDIVILHGSPAAGLFRDARTCSPVCVTATLLDGLVFARSARKLSFPAGILNFESSCGVCDSWGWARVGRRDCGWSGDDGCLLGEAGDRGFVGAVCLAQR